MKTIKLTLSVMGCVLALASVPQSHAIEGLKLQVRCPDVVLSWPSVEGETYIIQWRETLGTNTPWVTLANYWPAESSTNFTTFTHSNRVECLSGEVFGRSSSEKSQPDYPLVVSPNGSRPPVPLGLYPPGIDLTGNFILWPDGSANAWSAKLVAAWRSEQPARRGDPQPQDAGSEEPDTGFYRVVRQGVYLVGITNGMTLSGVVKISVEAGCPEESSLQSVTLTENNVPISTDAIHLDPFELPVPIITIDTTMISNGVHNLAALASWQLGGGTNPVGGFFEADCPSISVVISNEISFPNWMPYFGQLDNTLLISAQSAHEDTDWLIDIYGANAGYIGTFGGHTYDGTIYGRWDLVGPPPNYVHYTNEPWFEFKVSTPYSDPPVKTYKQTDPWPAPGGWVVVAQHAFDNVLGGDDLYAEIDGFIGAAGQAGLTVRPAPVNNKAFGIRFQQTGESADWATFRQALYHPLSRNLVYFGHGSPKGLGHEQNSTNMSILASEIGNMLHTIPGGQTNRHGFRMVILDGCSTAGGMLPEAFGIIHKENVPATDYINASMRFSAFAGWSADKWVGFLNGSAANYDHIHFIEYIQLELFMNGRGLKEAIRYAGLYPGLQFIKASEMKVFGLWDLNFWSFND